MLNIFKKKKVTQDIQKNPEFEIELIGAVLAYEIARSDGDISNSELNLLIEEIKKISKKVNKACCKTGDIKNNSILAITRLIVFPKLDKLDVKRKKEFGGNIKFNSYEDVEKAFESEKLHAADLKSSVAEAVEKIIAPIRKSWK